MKFQPTNSYLQVRRPPKKDSDSSFVVPDEFKPDTKATGTEVVEVVVGDDYYQPTDLIAVEATMLEEFQYAGKTYIVIKKQHVKGVFRNEV